MDTLGLPLREGFRRVLRPFAYLPRPERGLAVRRLSDTEAPPLADRPAQFEALIVETADGRVLSVEGFHATNPEGEALLAAWGGYRVRCEAERYFFGDGWRNPAVDNPPTAGIE